MHKALVSFIAGIVAFLVGAALYVTVLDGRGLGSSRWVLQCLDRKIEIARTAGSPKIVLLGGSNVLFGLRAALVAEATGRATVNMGVGVLLGADYMLFGLKPLLSPGDTVILAFEERLWEEGEVPVNGLAATVSLARGDGYWRLLSWRERLNYVLFQLSRKSVRQVVLPNLKAQLYSVDNLNAVGDDMSNVPTAKTRAWQSTRARKPMPPPPRAGTLPPAVSDFLAWANAHGVRVFATWPNQLERPIGDPLRMEMEERRFVDKLSEQGLRMIGTRRAAILPVDLMYDTLDHPSVEGAELRTRRFIDALCRETDLCRTVSH